MSRERPDPLTPPKSSLRGLDWFPFEYPKLLRSAFWRSSTDQVCKLSVELWCIAWQETPVASLPDDDEWLADALGFGRRNVADWKKIRRHVFKAWILCSDGRWYHKTLARIANERISRREKWRDDKNRQRTEMSTETSGMSTETSGMSTDVSRGQQVDSSRARSQSQSDSPSESVEVESHKALQEGSKDSQEESHNASRRFPVVIEGGKP